MKQAEDVAETIGYYLSKKGKVSTKGVKLIEDYTKQKQLITKKQLGHILDILEDIKDLLNDEDIELYEQLLTKYKS